MSFISPPTDSFYKFLAVGGLVAFLTCGFFIFKGEDSHHELLVKQEGEEKILQTELNLLTDEFKFNKKYKRLTDSINSGIGNLLNKETNSKSFNDSIYKEIFYNLPDSIQKKFKLIMLKKEELAVNKEFIMNQKSDHDSYFILYLIGLYLCEIAAVLGFIFWYQKIQKPLDVEIEAKEIQKNLQGDYWAERCQSCLRTFFFMNERGTEKDLTLNKFFCKNCYENGSFVEQGLTFEEASLKLKRRLEGLKYNQRKINRSLKKLKLALRWKRLKVW